MQIFPVDRSPWHSADPETFVGRVAVRIAAGDQTGVPVKVYEVRFEDGGRTNWHTHSGPQWLLVTDGVCRVQKWGEPIADVKAGEVVMIAPGEKHWHGAAAGTFGVHFAVNVDLTTTWLERVTDQQHLGTRLDGRT